MIVEEGDENSSKVWISTHLEKLLKFDNQYTRFKKRKKFRKRAAIELVLGHLKQHFRMGLNYLHRHNSPKINAMMAAAGWIFEKLMQ